jgi:hypothetical protein
MLLRFPNEGERDAFWRRLAAERRDIARRSRPAKTRPDLIVGDLDPEQLRWLEAEVDQASLFADIEFEPLAVD